MVNSMNLFLYLIIFISKVIENALATLRLIVVANGKKWLGAFLQLLVAIVWVLVTGAVVTGIREDPLKILFYGIGTFVGSFVGSFIEEKVALGSNMVMVITDSKKGDEMANKLREKGYALTVLEGCGKDKNRSILMILISRKKRPRLVSHIKKIDYHAMIVVENASTIHGGMSI